MANHPTRTSSDYESIALDCIDQSVGLTHVNRSAAHVLATQAVAYATLAVMAATREAVRSG